MTTINPNQGGVPFPQRPGANNQGIEDDGLQDLPTMATDRALLNSRRERLDASRREVPPDQAQLIREYQGSQREPRPMDFAPMYGMPVRPPIDGPVQPIDLAPMYGMPVRPPIAPIDLDDLEGPIRPIDMAPMYGMPVRLPDLGDDDDAPVDQDDDQPIRPIDLAPMYGMPMRPPVGPIDGPDGPIRPIDMAPMYGMPMRPPIAPIDLDDLEGPIRPIDMAPMYGMPHFQPKDAFSILEQHKDVLDNQ